jgi:hypothetical protein
VRNRFDVFPLPRLADIAKRNGADGVAEDKWCALLELGGPVDTASLDVEKRVACLSPIGVRILLQSVVTADTRCVVKVDLIARSISQKLEELEWLQDWNEDLVQPRVADGQKLSTELAEAARQFEAVMTATPAGREMSLRQMLYEREHAGDARRLFREEIKRRREG